MTSITPKPNTRFYAMAIIAFVLASFIVQAVSVIGWVAVEGLASPVQFGLYGLLVGLIHGKSSR